MQVFLPEANYQRCAEVLDYKRLVKQLLEGRQIMAVLAGVQRGNGWKNHPAVKMFEGHEHDLYFYLKAIRNEMRSRGYKWENNWGVIKDIYKTHFVHLPYEMPPWMTNDEVADRIITTHRGRLWQKDPSHYADYEYEGHVFMDYVCCPDKGCTYFWLTHTAEVVGV